MYLRLYVLVVCLTSSLPSFGMSMATLAVGDDEDSNSTCIKIDAYNNLYSNPTQVLYSISGRVDFRPKAPDESIPEAEIRIFQPESREPIARTRSQTRTGFYKTEGLPPGVYRAEVSAPGYRTDKAALGCCDLRAGSLDDQNVVLHSPDHNPLVGNLHSHTGYSDGSLTPSVAYRFARDRSHLQFFAVTDHIDLLTVARWADCISQSSIEDRPGSYAALWGYEWTYDVGHINIFNTKTAIIDWELNSLYQALPKLNCPAKFNHPGRYTKGIFNNLAYVPEADRQMCLIEVRDDFEQHYYFQALDNGWHVGADGSQDNHRTDWGQGPNINGNTSWTGLWGKEPTVDSIYEAVWNRRAFSTNDRTLQIVFWLNDHWMGERFFERFQMIYLHIEAMDTEPNDILSRLELYQDGELIDFTTPNQAAFTWMLTIPVPSPGREHYYVAKAIQRDGDAAWSSPIWVTFAQPLTNASRQWMVVE